MDAPDWFLGDEFTPRLENNVAELTSFSFRIDRVDKFNMTMSKKFVEVAGMRQHGVSALTILFDRDAGCET